MNHLLIGLGGTGGRVIKAFRKLLYQQYREAGPDGVFLDYLFIDSDPKSFRDDDPTWSVLGKSVQLPRRSQLPIAEANLMSVINDLGSHPNLKPWLGDRAAWGEILASLNVDAAGGQKRRLGRFLMAMNIGKFRDAAATLVRDLQDRSRATDLNFHLFCGLAGGTGSGAVIDVIAQLRAMFPDRRQRILVYAYLPDLNPPAAWNTGNYHANAYAALKELNAMAAGAWAPFDVAHGAGPVKAEFWFNGCYVFSDENDQGFRAGIDTELPDILADFAFQKIVVARKVAWDDLPRFENSENGDASPEAVAGSGQGQRAVRFLGFGIRRLAFPEESIREYLTYQYAVQSLRQLQFNHWVDGQGFVDQARPRADAEFVADAKTREDWLITDEHLRLMRPIIPTEGSRHWKPFDREWEEYETHFLQLAKQADTIKWLPELKTLFASAWNEGFRGVGVRAFFQTADRDAKNLAAAIRDRIEASLFGDWRNGTRSLNEVGRVLAALLVDLKTRAEAVDDFVLKRQDSAQHLARQLQAVESGWSELRIFGAVTNSRERDLGKAALLLREQAVAQVLAEAARFSRRLHNELRDQLTELKGEVDSGEAALASAAEQALKAVAGRQPGAAGTAAGGSTTVVRIEDPKAIEAVRRRLVLTEDEQRVQTAAVRADIVARLGQQASFRMFGRRMAEAEIRNAIVARCEANVESAHQRMVTERAERVIGVSVIEKLLDRWGADAERLDRETAELARSAGRFVVFDPTEQNKHFEGRSAGQRATEAFAVMMPEPPEHKAFVERIRAGFRQARQGRVSFVASNERANEITLVTLVNLFPLRFLRLARGLRERYEQRLQAVGRERGTLEIHVEGDGGALPELFIADDRERRDRARPVLLLADAFALATETRNPASGRMEFVLLRTDADGFALEPLVLGASLQAAAEDLSERALLDLRAAVLAAAAREPLLDEGRQGALRDAMLRRIETIRAATGRDPRDPEIVAWNGAARDAMKFVRKESEL